jgi:hypothetical protein
MEYYEQKFGNEEATVTSGMVDSEGHPEEKAKDLLIVAPVLQDNVKLPPISTCSALASPSAAFKAEASAEMNAETQRRPWHQVDVASATMNNIHTQRQFYSPASPRTYEVPNLPPLPLDARGELHGDELKVKGQHPSALPSSRSPAVTVAPAGPEAVPFRSATGAPLSPLAPRIPGGPSLSGLVENQLVEARAASSRTSRASQDSLTPSASAAKDLAALHSRLSIDGLLSGSPAESMAPEQTPAVPPPAPLKPPKPPAVFGTSGKATGIGALLGELDARREHKSGIDDPRLVAPIC